MRYRRAGDDQQGQQAPVLQPCAGGLPGLGLQQLGVARENELRAEVLEDFDQCGGTAATGDAAQQTERPPTSGGEQNRRDQDGDEGEGEGHRRPEGDRRHDERVIAVGDTAYQQASQAIGKNMSFHCRDNLSGHLWFVVWRWLRTMALQRDRRAACVSDSAHDMLTESTLDPCHPSPWSFLAMRQFAQITRIVSVLLISAQVPMLVRGEVSNNALAS